MIVGWRRLVGKLGRRFAALRRAEQVGLGVIVEYEQIGRAAGVGVEMVMTELIGRNTGGNVVMRNAGEAPDIVRGGRRRAVVINGL